MLQYKCDTTGLVYYDVLLDAEVRVNNTLLFILGYSRGLAIPKVSDQLHIPSYCLREGVPVYYAEDAVRRRILAYLATHYRVVQTDTGYHIPLYGLSLLLGTLGAVLPSTVARRRQRVPLFQRSEVERLYLQQISTLAPYNTGQHPWDAAEERYTIYPNSAHQPLDLYHSFGSWYYQTQVLYATTADIQRAPNYSAYYVWNSLAFEQLYHYSLGVLYALTQLGHGLLAWSAAPHTYLDGIDTLLYEDAYFWWQNAAPYVQSENGIYDPDPQLLRRDTYPGEHHIGGSTPPVSADPCYSTYGWLWQHTISQYHQSGLTTLRCHGAATHRSLPALPNKGITTATVYVGGHLHSRYTVVQVTVQDTYVELQCQAPRYSTAQRTVPDTTDTVLILSYRQQLCALPADLYTYYAGVHPQFHWHRTHPLYKMLYGRPYQQLPVP